MYTTASQPIFILPFPSHPNPTTTLHSDHLLSSLKSATSISHLKQIHAKILRSGLERAEFLLAELAISSLPLSSSLHYAVSVFDQIQNPKTRLANRFLLQLAWSREPERTLLVFDKLRREGVGVDNFSFAALLKASSKVSALMEGMELHGLASKLGFDGVPNVQKALVEMYTVCGRIFDARKLFDRMSQRTVVTWSIMINGYCRSCRFDDVFALFEEMKSSNVEPDQFILCTVLSACGRSRKLSYGKAIHKFIDEKKIFCDAHLQSALINMYVGCDCMEVAQNLYDQLFPKHVVVSTPMISGYSNLGRVEAARMIFNQLNEKDLQCWTAMIGGYATSYQPKEALKLFDEMQSSPIKPGQETLLRVIWACANLGVLYQAKWIHMCVDNHGFGEALHVNNALIDMYAQCGSLEGAREVFNKMLRKSVISWTNMISAFAMHGDADNALKLFHQMKAEDIKPNGSTFVAVLYACSHAGLVEEGREIFASMKSEFDIAPNYEHFGCMVDLFGRAKLLREAVDLVEQMPLAPNVVIWAYLMASCRVHGELDLGAFATKRLLELDPEHDGHVVVSDIYVMRSLRKWAVRRSTGDSGLSKNRGFSRIELNNEIHEFFMADRNHKQADEIYAKLDEVVSELKQVGYAPNTCDVLVDLDEEENKEMVLWHSEKLALCYGLMRGEMGSCIRVVKNRRICEDCHTFMKLVSKVYQRHIIVRDRTKFHHYKDGNCSCNDYW